MSKFKRFFSLALVAALTFTMNMTTFAATSKPDESERPVETVTASVAGLESIEVGETPARIEQDKNYGGVTEDQIYARATLNGLTENDLKNQTVTIVSTKNVVWPGKEGDHEEDTYEFTGVDLFNKCYDVTIGDTVVKIAAGLPAGPVAVSASDPLYADNLKLAGVDAPLTATNTANKFYGNDYYEYPEEDWEWTSIVYQFTTSGKLPSGTDLSSVNGTMTVASGATVSGNATGSNGNYTFNLSGANPSFTVTNGDDLRTYYVAAEVATDGIQVTYAIDLTEVVTDSTYSTQYAKNCTEILDGAEGYFNSVGAANVTKTNKSVSAVITVPTGTDAMKPMLDLTAWAESNNKFTETTKNEGTYLATLDGLGEFSCGQMSGWMYTDDSEGYSPNVTGPGVGAASYTMTNGQKITWYMTTNYFNHF